MARNEVISVSLKKSNEYTTVYSELKKEAESLEKKFGSIKIGNTAKALKEQAKAEQEAAKSIVAKSKAEKEAANAEKARYQAVKELENATKAHLSAEKEAQNVVIARVKTEKEGYNAIKAREQAERAAIQTQKAQLSLAKQQTTAHHSLANSIKSVALQYISFQKLTQSLRYAFTEMKNMSDAMAEYRKVTGATVQDMEALRTTAYGVAKAYGESASDVIASAANMARAGYHKNSMAMAELSTKTKLVGDMTQEAADRFLIAVDAAYKYGGSIEKLSSVLDAANALDNQYATTIEKISDGMTLVSSLAASAHIPVEQLMAALGTMTAVTQRSGTETARGLRSIILNVMGDTTTEIEEGVTATEESVKSMTDALMKYGDESIKAAVKAGKIINPMEAIVALQKAWKDNQISEQDLYQISNEVAGKRYYNVFTALIQNPEMYNSMIQSIAQSAGSAQNEIDILMDSWSKKLEKLKTTWTELVNKSITEGFIKDLISGGQAALEFAGSLENVAIMGLGAYEAIQSLSAGIKNMRMDKAFGGFNWATLGIGAAITAIGYWKASYENAQKEMVKSAQEAVENASKELDKSRSLNKILNKYKEIVTDGIQPEKGELEQLKTLQDELNSLVGEQANAIDIVNGKYDDTLVKLQNITKEQREAAIETAKVSMVQALASFANLNLNQSLLNDIISVTYDGFEPTGIGANFTNVPFVDKWIRNPNQKYLSYGADATGLITRELMVKRPKGGDYQQIIDFYNEVIALSELLSTHTLEGEKAGIKDVTIAQKYAGEYQQILTLIEKMKPVVDSIKEADAAYKAATGEIDIATSSLDSMNKSMKDAEKNTKDAASAAEDLSNKTDTLADSIKNATNAKNKFDEAMKNSKADAMNDYITAFETLQKEIDAGRVNSTAFYASARMLLGEEAYQATGGTSQGVLAALNKRGASGSISDAAKILNEKYLDANGNEIEGYGIYRLLLQTEGYSRDKLTSKEGYAYIPQLTDADIQAISRSWGGISEEVIKSFLNAFDQYDIYGEATDKNVQTKPEEGLADAETKAVEAIYEANKALNGFADLLNEITGAEETGTEETNKYDNTNPLDTRFQGAKTYDPSKDYTIGGDYGTPLTPEQSASLGARFATSGAGAIAQSNKKISESFRDVAEAEEEVSMAALDAQKRTKEQQKTHDELQKSMNEYSDAVNEWRVVVNAVKEADGYLFEAANKLGINFDDLVRIYENYQKFFPNLENKITEGMNPSEKLDVIKKQLDELMKEPLTFENVDVNTDKAEKSADKLINSINTKKATVEVNVKEVTTRSSGFSGISIGASSGGMQVWTPDLGVVRPGLATGTRYHSGGPALVNDGSGPELIADGGRAYIANGGKPAIVNLQKGARVFTANETRSIFSGSGIPAFAAGAVPRPSISGISGALLSKKTSPVFAIGTVTGGLVDSTVTIGKKGEEGKKKTSGSGSSGQTQKEAAKFDSLKDIINYIINRIGEALDEQVSIIDKQIDELKQQRAASEQQNELEEKQKAVAEAQKDLMDAISERTVRYIDENGQWHWMADARNVKSASESLEKAQKSLSEYEDDLAFNARVEALEAQKKALEDEYKEITKAWSDIQSAVSTPTGDLYQLLAQVISTGSGADKKGAETVKNLLVASLLQGGSFSGNYTEALDALAKATAGSPIMPGESTTALASLIAGGGRYADGDITDALKASSAPILSSGSYSGLTGGGAQTNYNYFINGMQLGTSEANEPLSNIMRRLTVYTNTGVA